MQLIASEPPVIERIRRLGYHRPLGLSSFAAIEAEPLNSRPDVKVWRVSMRSEEGETIQAIAKELCVEEPTDFHAELANYAFLQRHRARFDRVAKLLASDSKLLLLEDLGPATYLFKSDRHALESISDTFARMHLAFSGLEDEYHAIHREWEQASHIEGLRRNSEAGRCVTARKGVAMVADYLSLMGICPVEAFTTEAEKCLDVIFDRDSPLRTFIHDDVADRRQTVVTDGVVYLIDFEHGKYHHALMDLAKLLIGKVEHHTDNGGMFYNHPRIPSALAERYRARRIALGGPDLNDAEWDRDFVSALVVQVLLVIGRIVEIGGIRFVSTHASIIRDLLARLRLQTGEMTSRRELLALLHALEGRILVQTY